MKYKAPKHDPYIAAHEVGNYIFCPESYRLSLKGAKVNKASQNLMRQGDKAHATWARAGQQYSFIMFVIAIALIGLALYLLWGAK